MSLRVKLHLIITVLMFALVATMVALFIGDTRRSVHEEIGASGGITRQLLERLIWVGSRNRADEIAIYLRDLGRVRANNILLYDAQGKELYRSPPSTYKAGRNAPDWFADLVQPYPERRTIELGGEGRLVIEAEASRAVLDGWDDMLLLLGVAGLAFALANGLVYVLVGRAVSPFERIVGALRELERGALHTRLPALRGREAAAMGAAFNRMAEALEGGLEVRRQAAESEARLEAQRELSRELHARIEEERRTLARELHDELGQQVTAIRSIALAMAHRAAADAGLRSAAQALTETSNTLYDNMHAMIPRLRPLALDTLGLVDALADLVEDWRLRAPQITFGFTADALAAEPDDTVRVGVYRIVQESLSNAVRHARPTRIDVVIDVQGDVLEARVADDGVGMPPQGPDGSRHGIRSMHERAALVGGDLAIEAKADGGSVVRVRVPLEAAPRSHA